MAAKKAKAALTKGAPQDLETRSKSKPVKRDASTAASKRTANTKPANGAEAKKPRVFGMSFASVYPLYVQKAENKGRSRQEVDTIIAWLTGYDAQGLARVLETRVDFETFFAEAPQMTPHLDKIKGVVCGVRVEDVEDPLMQKIRYLDKLIDELAKGKRLESILRQA